MDGSYRYGNDPLLNRRKNGTFVTEMITKNIAARLKRCFPCAASIQNRIKCHKIGQKEWL